MRHEDFTSLEIRDVMEKIFAFCEHSFASESIHWLSALGLSRVIASTEDTWQWTFSTVDVIGKHVISRPEADLWDLFHVWKKIGKLYPPGSTGPYQAQSLLITPTSYFVLPVVYGLEMQGVLLIEGHSSEFPANLLSTIKPGLQLAAKYVAFAYQHLEVKNQSFLDELTGLHNQRYLPSVLQHEIERGRRDSAQFSLLFLDVDYFKLVNDGRGHWVGSKLLVELGHVLRAQIRACDYAFRYGGDEFIILLSGSNAQNSRTVAERIRKAVEEHTFLIEGQTLNLTVSIGLAAYPEHAQSAAGLIQLADQAMYYGKRKSRNVVFVAS